MPSPTEITPLDTTCPSDEWVVYQRVVPVKDDPLVVACTVNFKDLHELEIHKEIERMLQ